MSNRTIIEINHDMSHKIRDNPAAIGEEIAEYTRSVSHESADRLRRYGINVLGTVHHSDKISISFNKLT
jgi:hypothetical protein